MALKLPSDNDPDNVSDNYRPLHGLTLAHKQIKYTKENKNQILFRLNITEWEREPQFSFWFLKVFLKELEDRFEYYNLYSHSLCM